jgi:hypothetical protein
MKFNLSRAILALLLVSFVAVGVNFEPANTKLCEKPLDFYTQRSGSRQISNSTDDYIWPASFTQQGLFHNGLPGRIIGTDDPFNGFGVPYWTGNFSIEHPFGAINEVKVTYLPFTPDEYTYTLTEELDYLVHKADNLIELLNPVDVPILNEHWVDGVNNTLNGWPWINYVASGIESVIVHFPNCTTRPAHNLGYQQPPPNEWWYEPDWPWELEGWALNNPGIFPEPPYFWPLGSEWWVNYTAASYLTIDYTRASDIAVTDLRTSKIGCSPLETVGEGYPIEINATVKNKGGYTEIFNTTIFIDSSVVGWQNVTLNPFEQRTLSFTWNTTGVAKGNHYISTTADTVPGETYIVDNTMVYYFSVLVTIPGDVDGNRVVNIFDIVRMTSVFNLVVSDPKYDANNDIDGDGDIDIFDIVIACGNYGKEWS